MIEFQIIQSSDTDISEKHFYRFNKVSLSNTHKETTLMVDDSDMGGILFTLEVKGEQLLISTKPDKQSYLSNGKKTTGEKNHQVSEELTFGKTTIKILNFQQTKFLHDTPLPERYKDASLEPIAAKTLETLESELLHLEYILNAQNE